MKRLLSNQNVFNNINGSYIMDADNDRIIEYFMQVPGIGKANATKLVMSGIKTLETLSQMTLDQLIEIGVNNANARKILKNVQTLASIKTVDTTTNKTKSAATTPSPAKVAKKSYASTDIIAKRIQTVGDITAKDRKAIELLNIPVEQYIELTEEEVAKRLHFISKLTVENIEVPESKSELMEEINLGTFTPQQLNERITMEEKAQRDINIQAVEKRNTTIQTLFSEDKIGGEPIPDDRPNPRVQADNFSEQILDRSILLKRKSRKRNNSKISSVVNSMLGIDGDDN